MTTSVFDLPPTTSNIHHDDDKNNMTSGQVIWEGVVEATSTQPRVITPKHMRVRKHTYSVYATSVLQAPKDDGQLVIHYRNKSCHKILGSQCSCSWFCIYHICSFTIQTWQIYQHSGKVKKVLQIRYRRRQYSLFSISPRAISSHLFSTPILPNEVFDFITLLAFSSVLTT